MGSRTITARTITRGPTTLTPGQSPPSYFGMGGDCPGGDWPGCDCLGGDWPGGECLGGDCPGGECPGGDCPEAISMTLYF